MNSEFSRYTTSKGRQILSGQPSDRTNNISNTSNAHHRNQVAHQFSNHDQLYQYNPNAVSNHQYPKAHNPVQDINRNYPRKFDQSIVYPGAPQPKFSHSSVRDPRGTANVRQAKTQMKNSLNNFNQFQTSKVRQDGSFDGSDTLDNYSSRKSGCCPCALWILLGLLIFAGIGVGAYFGGTALAQSRKNNQPTFFQSKVETSVKAVQQLEENGKDIQTPNRNGDQLSKTTQTTENQSTKLKQGITNVQTPLQSSPKTAVSQIQSSPTEISLQSQSPKTKVSQTQSSTLNPPNIPSTKTDVETQNQVSPIDNTKPELTAFMIPLNQQQKQTQKQTEKSAQNIIDVGESSFMYPPQITHKIHHLIY